MDIKALDRALRDIIARRNELLKIDYHNPKYDELEELLHEQEDDFQEEFGEYMEKVLQTIHDQHCPDSDVLHPVAYIAKAYAVNGHDEFQVGAGEGIYVEMDKYPGKDTRLALVPGPLRVVLNVGTERQEVLWTAR